jgi:hypothetical protein
MTFELRYLAFGALIVADWNLDDCTVIRRWTE